MPGWNVEAIHALREAMASRDGGAVLAAAESATDDAPLQLVGAALLATGHQRHAGFEAVARRCVGLLRSRGWPGDAQLAEDLEDFLGDRPGPPARAVLPIDLEELAFYLEGDFEEGARIDMRTGAIWPAEPSEVAGLERPPHWNEEGRWVDVEPLGSASALDDMRRFVSAVSDNGLGDELRQALKSKSPQRKFGRVVLQDPAEGTRWLAFAEERARGRARAWLASKGVRAIPPGALPARNVPRQPPASDVTGKGPRLPSMQRRARDRLLRPSRRPGPRLIPLLFLTGLIAAILVGGLALLYFGHRVGRVEDLALGVPVQQPSDEGVYGVLATDPDGNVRLGSAFTIVSQSGESVLLTNYRVVATGDGLALPSAQVHLPEGVLEAAVHAYDAELDLAVLIVQQGPLPVPGWRSADEPVVRGDRLWLLGGGGPHVETVLGGTAAGVSADAVVPSVPVNAFLAGGPLVDRAGRVVAVSSLDYAPFGQADGTLTYAVPIRAVCRELVRCAPGELGADEIVPPGDQGASRTPESPAHFP